MHSKNNTKDGIGEKKPSPKRLHNASIGLKGLPEQHVRHETREPVDPEDRPGAPFNASSRPVVENKNKTHGKRPDPPERLLERSTGALALLREEQEGEEELNSGFRKTIKKEMKTNRSRPIKRKTITDNPNIIVVPEAAEEAMDCLVYANGDLTDTFSVLDLSVLKNRFKCRDVFPIVEIDLVKNQDKCGEKRAHLADEVWAKLSTSMRQDFTGSPRYSELVLLVRITVVSGGTRQFERFDEFMGSDQAKLSVSYCLYRRKTGQVAVAKRFSYGRRLVGHSGNAVELLEFADGIRYRMMREVKFVCCSRLKEWPEVAEGIISGNKDESMEMNVPALWGQQ